MARAAIIPQSPPRRATRARTRVTSETAEEPNADFTRSKTKTTEPAKRGRKPKTVDRKAVENSPDITMDDETDDEIGLQTVNARKDAAPTKARPSRPPKAAATSIRASAEAESDDDDELAQSDVPKRKVGRPKTKPVAKRAESANLEPAVKPTRGRPRTVKTTADEIDAETAGKKPRGRPTLKTAVEKKPCIATAATASSLAKSKLTGGPVKAKKVTFADISDSEKEDPSSSSTATGRKKGTASSASSQTGLRAKPVRKAAASSGRGRPPKASQTAGQPLSPKKATQVAKSNSSASSEDPEEDELSGAKTGVTLVVRSPTKHSSENIGLSSPVKKINFAGMATPSRTATRNENNENAVPAVQPPSGMRDSMFIGSPARRLPGTPKDTLRDTPRRGPLFVAEQSVSKPESNPTKTSPLKASPKKAGLGTSFTATPLKGSTTPFKAKFSLLQSPAKRIQSPFPFKFSSPMKKKSEEVVDKDADVDMHVDASSHLQKDSHEEALKLSDDELNVEEINTAGKEDEDDSDDVFTDSHTVLTSENNVEEPLQIPEEQLLEEEEQIMEEDEGTLHIEETLHVSDEDEQNMEESGGAVHADQEDAQPSTTISEDQDIDQSDALEHDEVQDVVEDLPTGHEYTEAPIADAAERSEETSEAPEKEEHFVIYGEQEDETESIASIDQHCEPPYSPALSYTGQPTESAISPYEVSEMDELASSIHRLRTVPPPAPSPPSMPSMKYPYRDDVDDEESDDELASDGSPRRQNFSEFARHDTCPETPASDCTPREQASESSPSFTPLVAQLSQWKASSPNKAQRGRSQQRGIFSPVIPAQLAMKPAMNARSPQLRGIRRSLGTRRSLLSQSVGLDSGNDTDEEHVATVDGAHEIIKEMPDASLFESADDTNRPRNSDDAVQQDREVEDTESETQGEEEYGDENAAPSAEAPKPEPVPPAEDISEANEASRENPRLPMHITPTRINRDAQRTIHTVSKVPLRPAGEVSPIKMPRKRSRSLSIEAAIPTRTSPRLQANSIPKSHTLPSLSSQKSRDVLEAFNQDIPSDTETEGHQTKPFSTVASPVKTPRRNISADEQVLRGAVVFVDVHTTEGEDASGIFVELLTQMGARCVKTWSWNPRASQSPVGAVDPKESKVGITHVVYKDGGVRTLEKVRHAGELVKCVGVGWVLDCERENKWLDESHYLVDRSMIPRGGAKRRKSMEPRALANINGSLTSSVSSRRSRVPADRETIEEFMKLSPNTPPNASGESSSSRTLPDADKTPTAHAADDSTYDFSNFNFDFTMSPATPYFLSQGAKLIQQTCPPKQTQQGLFFPLSGEIEDEPNPSLRAKLEAARRKSLVFKPKVGSPLGR